MRKKGAVVKYDPNRRVPVKEKHYRRYGAYSDFGENMVINQASKACQLVKNY